MRDLLAPADIVVALIVLGGVILGFRRMAAAMLHGRSCCEDGAPRARAPQVADTRTSSYPYVADFQIAGMSCENCARSVEVALDALPGTWAHVELSSGRARVLSKEPIDEIACERAVAAAGYEISESRV